MGHFSVTILTSNGSVLSDIQHTAHRLQMTLTPAQEAVAVALRKTLLVSLDDLLAVAPTTR